MPKKNKLAKFMRDRTGGEHLSTIARAGVGFAGYASSRLLSRIIFCQLCRRFPRLAPHASAGVSLLSAAVIYLVTKYWSRVEQYHEAATTGGVIALLQTLLQVYVPKFGWVVSDVHEDQYRTLERGAVGTDELEQLLADEVEIEAPSEVPELALPAESVTSTRSDDEDDPEDHEELSWGLGSGESNFYGAAAVN